MILEESMEYIFIKSIKETQKITTCKPVGLRSIEILTDYAHNLPWALAIQDMIHIITRLLRCDQLL